jgi:hypothetical protein
VALSFKIMEMTPQNKQYLLYAGVAIALVGGYYMFFSTPAPEVGGGIGTDPTGNGIANAGSAGYVFNAYTVANDLYDAMKDSGTDEQFIIDTLTHVNANQFAQVFQAFGSLAYNSTLGNQYQLNPFSPLPKVNLKGWLYSELSTENYRILKLKYPNNL